MTSKLDGRSIWFAWHGFGFCSLSQGINASARLERLPYGETPSYIRFTPVDDSTPPSVLFLVLLTQVPVQGSPSV
jgi:hypothetical protein